MALSDKTLVDWSIGDHEPYVVFRRLILEIETRFRKLENKMKTHSLTVYETFKRQGTGWRAEEDHQ